MKEKYTKIRFVFTNIFTGSSCVQVSDSQKCAQLQSILKKPQQLSSSSQSSSVLILQPSQHLSKEVPIELSNFKFSMTKSSTLPRPLPPPRSSTTTASSTSQNYVCGTLDRHNSRAVDFGDLRV